MGRIKKSQLIHFGRPPFTHFYPRCKYLAHAGAVTYLLYLSKQTNRFIFYLQVKKLRDALGLKAIASYYIKTLFLWKIETESDRKYWQNKISFLFQTMVEELHDAIVKKNIPYYWNPSNNLIATLKPTLQKLYADKLLAVVNSLKAGDIERSVAFLLNAEELVQYKESEFYKHHLNLLANASLKQQVSTQSVSSNGSQSSQDNDSMDTKSTNEGSLQNDTSLTMLKALISKLDKLTDKVDKMSVSMNDKIDLLTDKMDRLTDKVILHEKMLKHLERDTVQSFLFSDTDTNFSLLGENIIPANALP